MYGETTLTLTRPHQTIRFYPPTGIRRPRQVPTPGEHPPGDHPPIGEIRDRLKRPGDRSPTTPPPQTLSEVSIVLATESIPPVLGRQERSDHPPGFRFLSTLFETFRAQDRFRIPILFHTGHF
jgi:hypothetical protein